MNNDSKNKPIALAVTLVILVICLMLCIVFVSKNISINQEKQIDTGKTIVNLLEKIQRQSSFVATQLENKEVVLEKLDTALYSHANDIMFYELERLNSDISELFLVTSSIKPDRFTEQTLLGEVPVIKELLNKLAQSNYIENEQLYEELHTVARDIIESTSQFNFKLAQSKNSMIRMSNGFEWDETLKSLITVVSRQ